MTAKANTDKDAMEAMLFNMRNFLAASGGYCG
jgi:hypothetical protein